MADDDVLINFDAGSAPFVPQEKFTGGRWRERLIAKKQAKWKQENGTTQPALASIWRAQGATTNGTDLQDGTATERPAKRIKGPEGAIAKDSGESAYSRPVRGAKKATGDRQVISSLFSFNPSAKSVQRPQREDAQPAAPSNAPLPPELQNFVDLGLSPMLAQHILDKMSIKAPTAVQRSAVSQLLKEDADAFIQAETGSGKTLAYLLPIVQKLWALSVNPANGQKRDESIDRHSGLFAIILTPTRELSRQISVVLEMLLRCAHWIVSTTVTGGEKKKSEKARLRKGVNILIATPGRLADHLEHTEVLNVSNVRWLVLDEGDRLMEMGFEKDIEKILNKLEGEAKQPLLNSGLPQRRMTVLCSATMKMDVQKLGELSLKDAVHIRADASHSPETKSIGRDSGEKDPHIFAAPAQLQQSFAIVPAKLRLVSLVGLLKKTFARRGSVMKAIVFMSCADSVDFHFDIFARRRQDSEQGESGDDPHNTSAPAISISSKANMVRVFKLHGSLPQAVRTATLARYRGRQEPAVLICTDVASRGLDLPNVDFVVEYDPPFCQDDHLHRVGRTARAGKEGRAMIFLLPGSEEAYVEVLKRERGEGAGSPKQHSCDELLRRGFSTTGLDGDKTWQVRATEWQLDVERWAVENPGQLEHARRAFQAHIRAYATHVAVERHMFDMTQLHLGHMAKAFALRDKPGSIRVPGLRPSANVANANKAERKAQAGKHSRKPADNYEISDGKSKMAAKMKEQGRLSEFNLG